MFCLRFIFILFFFIFNDFVRPIISTSTGTIFTKFAGLVEPWLWMNDLKLGFRSLKGRCRGNQFCRPHPGPIHRNGFACDSVDGGVRQEVQVLRWTQASQRTDQLTIIYRRLAVPQRGFKLWGYEIQDCFLKSIGNGSSNPQKRKN